MTAKKKDEEKAPAPAPDRADAIQVRTQNVIKQVLTTDMADVMQDGKIDEDKIRERLKALKKVVDLSYFEMGRWLYVVQDRRSFAVWKYESFGEYVETELGFKERKGAYLISIWKAFSMLGLSEEDLDGLDWSHAKEIARLKDPVEARAFIDKVKKGMGVRQLSKSISGGGEAPEGAEAQKKIVLVLMGDQIPNVEQALARAQTLSGSDKVGNAVDLICTDFLAGNAVGDTPVDWLVGFLKRMEHMTGLSFAVMDQKKKQVVYRSEAFGEGEANG